LYSITYIALCQLEDQEEIPVGRRNLNNLHYADDSMLLANSESNLQRLLDVLVHENASRGLTVNNKKNFCLVISTVKVALDCCFH